MTDDLAAALLAEARRTNELLERLAETAGRRRVSADLVAYPLRQAARLLGVHPDRLREHVNLGDVRTARFGRRHRIAREEIDRVLREGLPELSKPEAAEPPRGKREKSPPTRAAAPAAAPGLAERIRSIKVR